MAEVSLFHTMICGSCARPSVLGGFGGTSTRDLAQERDYALVDIRF